MKTRLAWMGLLGLVACGGGSAATASDAGGADAADASVPVDAAPPVDNGAPSTTYPAFAPDVPQVASAANAPVLAHTRIVPVYFANDDFEAQTKDFLAKLAPSADWTTMVGEYGVLDATVTPGVDLVEDAPAAIEDAAIKTWLAGKLDANDPAWPVADAGAVYTLFYPATTVVTFSGQTSCKQFGGYHNETTLKGGQKVAYAVIPRCQGTFNLRSVVVSHELVEAATDPYPNLQPAYELVDEKHAAWMISASGGEIGDMCQSDPLANYQAPDLGLAIVQRSYSNKAAAAHHDPCVPALPGSVYFNSTPVLPDTIAVTIPAIAALAPLGGKTFHVEGVSIPVGQSKTIDVHLWSDGDTKGPWKVQAVDVLQERGYSLGPTLSFAWDRTSGQNGEILHLTISALASSVLGVSPFRIVSTQSPHASVWTGVVDTR